MSVVPSGPRRRLAGDQGSALVEAGLLSPVFLFLILAIIEYGFYFSAFLALGRATTDAARTASVMGNASDADYEIIQSIELSVAALDQTDVKKIIVFNASADGFNAVVPPACNPSSDLAGTASGCNGYTSAAFSEPKARFGCTSPNNLSAGYCPTTRKVAFLGPSPANPSANGPPDYIGIYIRFNHSYITGLFGDSKVIEETVITRIEPSEVS